MSKSMSSFSKWVKLFLSPEKSIEIQNNLGADIIMSFDECPPFDSTEKYMRESVERTIRWAKRGKDAHKNPDTQALFGIVQGGGNKEIRKHCLEELEKIGFPGYSIGGLSVGESKEDMYEMLEILSTVAVFLICTVLGIIDHHLLRINTYHS